MKASLACALALVTLAGGVGCGPPDPEEIELSTKASGDAGVNTPPAEETTITVGDLVALEAKPVDDDGDRMKLCIEASSSASDIVDVRRASGRCDEPRLFVLGAKRPGTARIRFSVRGTSRELTIVVRD